MICNVPKQIISASGDLELLQMVSEPDTKQCANKDARPPRRWIVRSHISWRVNETTLIKGVETSP